MYVDIIPFICITILFSRVAAGTVIPWRFSQLQDMLLNYMGPNLIFYVALILRVCGSKDSSGRFYWERS